ncbi:MAG: rRNA maturation RNase YbeY [Nitrospiraceae bacterium]|nr:MAG: rRNA maturation RNase YbeY [Nitrospiraceae bacterium]
MKVLIRNRQRHRPLDKDKINRSALNILSLASPPSRESELSILFVGDRAMRVLNRDYRGCDRSTDVLSFEAAVPVTEGEAAHIMGDIVICVPKAELQARASGVEFHDEIIRLLIHGTLHLLGYDHEQSSREARKMSKKEREISDALTKMDPERQPRN